MACNHSPSKCDLYRPQASELLELLKLLGLPNLGYLTCPQCDSRIGSLYHDAIGERLIDISDFKHDGPLAHTGRLDWAIRRLAGLLFCNAHRTKPDIVDDWVSATRYRLRKPDSDAVNVNFAFSTPPPPTPSRSPGPPASRKRFIDDDEHVFAPRKTQKATSEGCGAPSNSTVSSISTCPAPPDMQDIEGFESLFNTVQDATAAAAADTTVTSAAAESSADFVDNKEQAVADPSTAIVDNQDLAAPDGTKFEQQDLDKSIIDDFDFDFDNFDLYLGFDSDQFYKDATANDKGNIKNGSE